ncbi:MAG TPA: neutral/alkaline non-lysosomal ceramidase N-terminal domain-containing protein [Candidatus Dormibacteraeota bacterium]|nr:neutral/alkaline non-lysosomal ceramidase N-terminal domain-containing protein [Candidatus Dormibacteraeota bacterium]
MHHAGWARAEIAVEPDGYAMFGYGMWHHRALGKQTPLFARAFCISDGPRRLIFCCADLGSISYAVRAGVCEVLRERLGAEFDDASLVLACTHTHSGPGGCSHEALYNVVTPGFVTPHFLAVVRAIGDAILGAWRNVAAAELKLYQAAFDDQVPVAWNRSLRAYNRNPDVVQRSETERHLAVNRTMHVLGFHRDGRVQALLSLFGVHATCIGNALEKYDGDNKGYAAAHAEQMLRDAGAADPVAIFAQATAGDISPHFHGPGDWERRKAITGAAEYQYAERNGRAQSERALSMLAAQPGEPVDGPLDAIFSYVDFSAITAEPRFANGNDDARTSEPCHGVSFFAGTPVDGRGMSPAVAMLARAIAGFLKRRRFARLERLPTADRDYYRRVYAAQGPKAILLEAGRKMILGQRLGALALPDFVDPTIAELKRQARIGALEESPLVPTLLPLQIVCVGGLAIVCCPGEFTTTAGARLIQSVAEVLQSRGTRQALICTYANDYMGYVTTNEEYQEQCYEGGHTIFGQWTLAAFQTRLTMLARELLKPDGERRHDRTTRPPRIPPEELAKRSDLPLPA